MFERKEDYTKDVVEIVDKKLNNDYFVKETMKVFNKEKNCEYSFVLYTNVLEKGKWFAEVYIDGVINGRFKKINSVDDDNYINLEKDEFNKALDFLRGVNSDFSLRFSNFVKSVYISFKEDILERDFKTGDVVYYVDNKFLERDYRVKKSVVKEPIISFTEKLGFANPENHKVYLLENGDRVGESFLAKSRDKAKASFIASEELVINKYEDDIKVETEIISDLGKDKDEKVERLNELFKVYNDTYENKLEMAKLKNSIKDIDNTLIDTNKRVDGLKQLISIYKSFITEFKEKHNKEVDVL